LRTRLSIVDVTFIQLQQNLNVLFNVKLFMNTILTVQYTNLLYCIISLYELRNVSTANLRVS